MVVRTAADAFLVHAQDDAGMSCLDHRDAGFCSGEQLRRLVPADPVVIVPPPTSCRVGFEVAQRLGAPLDVLAVGRLAVSGSSQLAVGALVDNGAQVWMTAPPRALT